MTLNWRWLFCPSVWALASFIAPLTARGQIDPDKRELIQFGYNAPLEGHPPLSAYAYFYLNQPGFLQTNWTLRLALAPTYLDSELGLGHVLGENTGWYHVSYTDSVTPTTKGWVAL